MYASHYLHLSPFLNLYRFLYLFHIFHCRSESEKRSENKVTLLFLLLSFNWNLVSDCSFHQLLFSSYSQISWLNSRAHLRGNDSFLDRVVISLYSFIQCCYWKTFLFYFYCELVQVLKVEHSHEGRGKATLKVFFFLSIQDFTRSRSLFISSHMLSAACLDWLIMISACV